MGAAIYAEAIPIAPGLGRNALELALHGGDEYEMLFTAGPRREVPKQIAGVAITLIGEIVRGKKMKLVLRDGSGAPLLASGWQHFQSR